MAGVFVTSYTPEERFRNFWSNYNTSDKRLKIARQLADRNRRTAPKFTHPSHALLIAHWGRSKEQMRDVAYHTYNLIEEVANHACQAIAVYEVGTPEVSRGDEVLLSQAVALAVGTVSRSVLMHRTGGRDESGYVKDGVKSPYVTVATGVPVRNRRRLEITEDWQVKLSQPVPGETLLPLYRATIGLNPDLSAYNNNEAVERFPVVYGDGDVIELLRSIAAKLPLGRQWAAGVSEQAERHWNPAIQELGRTFGALALPAASSVE